MPESPLRSVATSTLSAHVDWSTDVLPWIAPIATCVGVVAASVAAFYAIRVYRRDSERLAREQAMRFSVWIGDWRDGAADHWFTWHARNSSELPVYDVRVGAVPVADPDEEPFALLVRPSLAPGFDDSWEYTSQQKMGIAVRFRDSAGVDWFRDINGRLSRTDGGKAPRIFRLLSRH